MTDEEKKLIEQEAADDKLINEAYEKLINDYTYLFNEYFSEAIEDFTPRSRSNGVRRVRRVKRVPRAEAK